MSPNLGYSLNVHPGETLDEVCAALEGPVARVAKLVEGELLVGIYLGARAVEDVSMNERSFTRLAASVAASGARVFTANAFPYGGFHDERVKHAVYRPTWEDPRRANYTLAVASVLARLGVRRGSISTLPLGFGSVDRAACARNLLRVARGLERLAAEQGSDLALAIEPEPRCVIEKASELVAFLEEHVFREGDVARRRIGACLDACHHAVVFEEIEDALALYARAGVRVVKAQLSSALSVRDVASLRAFAEPRYLHQTSWRRGGRVEVVEDIDAALERARGGGEVRSHFHVPLAWAGDERVGTTRPLLERALPALARATEDLEVETYTWSVLPEATRARFGGDVSAMVAAELAWVKSVLRPSKDAD